MISKDSKYFNFISLTFVGPARTLRRLVHALLANRKHPIHHIGSGRYSCNRSLGVQAQWFFALCPLMLLQGPYFSTEGFLGLPKLKDKILVRTLSKYDRKSIISYKWPLVPFQVWPLRSICKARIIVFPCFFARSTFFLLFYTMFTMLCCIVFFLCRWCSHCGFITSVHSSKQNFCNKKIRP